MFKQLIKHHAIKMYGKWRYVKLQEFKIKARNRCGQIHAPTALTLHPLERRLGEPQSQCGQSAEEKNPLPFPEI
jgi:hypothetical protein